MLLKDESHCSLEVEDEKKSSIMYAKEYERDKQNLFESFFFSSLIREMQEKVLSYKQRFKNNNNNYTSCQHKRRRRQPKLQE